MTASASAIADELVTVLEAMANTTASKRGYDILETSADRFCVVVRPSVGSNTLAQFGGDSVTEHQDITLLAEAFVKDLGDPYDYMTAQWTFLNQVQTQLDDYATLNDTCMFAMLERWEVPETEYNIGGQIWQPIRFWVRCLVV